VSRRPWIVLVVALVGFAALAAAYDHEPLESVDTEVADWVSASLPGELELATRPFAWLGGWIGLTALGIVAGAFLVRERAWLDLGFFLAAYVGSQIAVIVLKPWFDRPRPDVGSAVPLPESAAFPSGHAAAGVASLGALAVLVAARLPDRRARLWTWIVVVVVGLAVGISRIA
jgi:undecaprenyl-diphosphatase